MLEALKRRLAMSCSELAASKGAALNSGRWNALLMRTQHAGLRQADKLGQEHADVTEITELKELGYTLRCIWCGGQTPTECQSSAWSRQRQTKCVCV
eukprot:743761-Pelagomonas_calceolata.AAC.1